MNDVNFSDSASLEAKIRTKLKEIMMQVDLEEVTTRYVSTRRLYSRFVWIQFVFYYLDHHRNIAFLMFRILTELEPNFVCIPAISLWKFALPEIFPALVYISMWFTGQISHRIPIIFFSYVFLATHWSWESAQHDSERISEFYRPGDHDNSWTIGQTVPYTRLSLLGFRMERLKSWRITEQRVRILSCWPSQCDLPTNVDLPNVTCSTWPCTMWPSEFSRWHSERWPSER